MRLNSAYAAIEALQKNKLSLLSAARFLENKAHKKYCLIPLSINHSDLIIAGKTYHSEKVPHISIYQFYNPNEARGLSVFHYTWYGFINENEGSTSVVLHVYFDRVGRYRNCQLKNRETNEVIQPISPEEEKTIKQYAQKNSEEVLNTVLLHITKHFEAAQKSIDSDLATLDKLSQHLPTQFAKYKQTATSCIKAMQQADIWTFGNIDPRAAFLNDIVSILEENIKNQPKQNNHGFYSSAKTPNKQKEKPPEIIKKSSKQKTSNQIEDNQLVLIKLQQVEDEIVINDANSQITDVDKILLSLDLLNNKFRLLTCLHSQPSLENKLIGVLQQINNLYNQSALLFETKALESDLEALQRLKPFVSNLDLFLFKKLLIIGNVEVCQFIVQSFDSSIFYINFLAFSLDEKDDLFTQSTTLLNIVFACHENPALFKMLLENGANPNYCGASSLNERGVLHLSIVRQREDFVQLLLEHGANPNPESGKATSSQFAMSEFMQQRSRSLKQFKSKPDFEALDDNLPLHTAIRIRNKNIIALLLKNGASVTKQNSKNFDAIGYASCHENHLPDLEIIQMLINYGADINAIQGKSDLQTTALHFACQRNDLISVKGFIELGANPNQQVLNKMLMSSGDVFYLPITAFKKAVLKKHQEIALYLLEQNEQPISFITAAMTASFMLRSDARLLRITDENVIWDIPGDPLFEIICSNIEHKYSKEIIMAVVQTIYNQGKTDYTAGKYEQALYPFYLCLLFGEPKQRPSVHYSLALCYKKQNETLYAKAFFKSCMLEDSPDSVLYKRAQNQLEELSSHAKSISFGI